MMKLIFQIVIQINFFFFFIYIIIQRNRTYGKNLQHDWKVRNHTVLG